jgi:hypothetical protein
MGRSPKAPDPYETANAQFQQNMGASGVSAIMNNPNTFGPTGSTQYKIAGYETITGPDGQKIKVPRYNQTTTLDPAMQKQWDSRNSLISQLFGQAQTGLGQKPQEMPDWRTGYKAEKLDTGGYAPKGGFSADRRRVEEAMMSRGNELLGQNREGEVARLAAMGLAPGSEKYGRVSDQFERSANDLAMQAILAGGQEQSRQLGEARNALGFTNASRMQQTQQNAQQAGFNNQTRSAMGNEEQQRRTAILNQLMAAFTGTQVNQPNVPGFQGQGVGAPDIAGAINNNYAQQMAAYNNKMMGIGGIIGAGLGFM